MRSLVHAVRLLLVILPLICLFSCGKTDITKDVIQFKPGKNTVVTVTKIPVIDSRVVRGFRGTPVDGTVKSIEFRGFVSEYPDTLSEGFDASSGVDYSYNNNDGLHITLKNDSGFDAMIIRGGASLTMYTDISSIIKPDNATPVHVFKGGGDVETVHFGTPVKSSKIDFFDVGGGGTIADMAFFRIGRRSRDGKTETWIPTTSGVSLIEPSTRFAPESPKRALEASFDKDNRAAVALEHTSSGGMPIEFEAGRAVHFLTPSFENETGMEGIELAMNVKGPKEPFVCTAIVHDPLDPALDLMWFRFTGTKAGGYRIALDFPDQVILPGSQVWITLSFDAACTLCGPTGGGAPEFGMRMVPREKALPEAVEYRKFSLKTIFALLSECRPWGAYRKQSRDEFFGSNIYAGLCPELFLTIDLCNELAPDDPMTRQYREWVFVNHLDDLSTVAPPEEPPSGVPDWAWYPRQAWLETRRLAKWWLDNRLVPTGEFGGKVSDDSDLYQQFADMPFFETDGVTKQVLDGAVNLAELAERENLRDGVNILTCDTLHAYEEGINHTALMARWFYGDPLYLERCMVSARNIEKYTVVTKDGRRLFRDRSNLGHEDLANPRTPAVDGHATTLLWHTTLQTADYNRNPLALKVVREWADTWLKYQKPGQWATSVEVETGKVLEFSDSRPLYGGYSTQATVFTWLYGLTGQAKYLEPFMYYYRKGEAPAPSSGFLNDAYSLGLLKSLPAATLDKLTESNALMQVFRKQDASALIQATIGNPRSRTAQITNLYDFKRWPDMYTTAEQFVDRLFFDVLGYGSQSYLGGLCRRNKFNPTLAVSWSGFGTDYGALVTENTQSKLSALVYSYSVKPMEGSMRVWNLDHGRYTLKVGIDANGDNVMDAVDRTETLELAKADSISITLKPKAVTVITLEQVEKLDPIYTRADLAIAARDVIQDGMIVHGDIHNIGSKAADSFKIAVVNNSGIVVAEETVAGVEAPLDLVPKTVQFRIQVPGVPEKGWKLVVDPDNVIPEIYEGNNTAFLRALGEAHTPRQ